MGKVLKSVIALWGLCAVVTGLTGCNGDGCIDNRSSIPMAQFYSYDAKETPLSIDSISIYGIGQSTDSVLLQATKGVTLVYLPLRFTQDSTQYVIHYEQRGLTSPRYNDTLTFVYKAYPYFESVDCGAMYNFAIDTCRYTRNVLDSVSVTVPVITNKNQETVRIFYTVQN